MMTPTHSASESFKRQTCSLGISEGGEILTMLDRSLGCKIPPADMGETRRQGHFTSVQPFYRHEVTFDEMILIVMFAYFEEEG
jgi:hypothetical protein